MDYDACSCDFDPPEFIDSRVMTARKARQCIECRCQIQPGEKYEYTSGKWDGDFQTFATCDACFKLRQWAQVSVPCFCWVYGDTFGMIRNLVREAKKDMPPGWVMEWGRKAIKVRQKCERYGRELSLESDGW